MYLIERSEYDDDVVADQKGQSTEDVVKRCCWLKGQNTEDVADRKRSKCWRCCFWSKGQSVEDVADRKVKVLKMLLLIERSKCWRCFWSKDQSVEDVVDQKVKRC